MVEYTIHVRNDGSADIGQFLVTDELPAGVTFQSVSDNGVYDPVNNKVSFTSQALLKIGDIQSFTFTVKVKENLEGIGSIKNIALITTGSNTIGTPSFPPLDNKVDPSLPDLSTI